MSSVRADISSVAAYSYVSPEIYIGTRVTTVSNDTPTLGLVRGVAVYTELDQRSVTVPIDPAHLADASGQVTIKYIEPTDSGPVTIAETSAVLR